jgi:hypothetical protein
MIESLKQLGNPKVAFARLKSSGLCRRDTPATTAKEIIGWWELRRIPFNLIVGSAGILTCIVVFVLALSSSIFFGVDFGLPDPPIFLVIGIVLYGIAANIFFTGGWVVELIVRKFRPVEADRFAETTFPLGLIFSVLLTLTPGIVIGIAGIFALIRHSHGAPLAH